MSYEAAIERLKAMVPELYTGPGQVRRKFSLGEVGLLLRALGDPQLQFRSVLIAGTNGKGSTAATLASILTASGVRTGLYTSPHLARPNERICVDGSEIGNEEFARHYFRVEAAARKLVGDGALAQSPSFFETLTAMAFLHFAEAGVELAVLEVGMGGRLDATNIVDPLLSVVTDISLDHTEWLGSSIAAIAREKAGIVRRGGVLITLPQHPEASRVLAEVAAELGVREVSAAAWLPPQGSGKLDRYFVEALGEMVEVASPLAGGHQQRNVALAIAAAVELRLSHGFRVTPASIAAGIKRTRWPGRLERIEVGGVRWILDVAHNAAGAGALRQGLENLLEGAGARVLVFSCLRDKALGEMARILFPLFDQVILAPIRSSRGTPIAELEAAARAMGSAARGAQSVGQAMEWAGECGLGGTVVVAGSVYLVGEARSLLLDEREGA